MYILKPTSRERIWGTDRLHEYQGDRKIRKIGSVYSASGITGIDCSVVDEELTFGELITKNPSKFGLKEGEVYPLIISFTACDEDLSIQVHPTDSYAKEKEKMPYGKSEAWYFITPPQKGWIYAEQQLAEKSAVLEAVEKDSYEKILRHYPVNKGDLVYIPSGTIHALTKGALVYEIQQSTDLTYRFYDYDRLDKNGKKRDLHVEKALETLDIANKVEKQSFFEGDVCNKKEFVIQHFVGKHRIKNTSNLACILTIISGEIKISDAVCSVGESIALLKDEIIDLPEKSEAILAKPIAYWR